MHFRLSQNLVSLKSWGRYNLRSSGGILLASSTFRTKVTLGDRSFQVAVECSSAWTLFWIFVIRAGRHFFIVVFYCSIDLYTLYTCMRDLLPVPCILYMSLLVLDRWWHLLKGGHLREVVLRGGVINCVTSLHWAHSQFNFMVDFVVIVNRLPRWSSSSLPNYSNHCSSDNLCLCPW